MEFVGQGDVIIEPPTIDPIPPENYTQKDIVRISTEDISEWKWMLLEINGTGLNLTDGVEPDTLTIFWYNIIWTSLNTTIKNNTNEDKTYSVNVTSEASSSLGIFGLFGKPLQPNKEPTIMSVTATPKGPYKVDDKVTVTVVAEDPEDDTLWYRFDWDDGKGPGDWKTENTESNNFKKGSTYIVRVYVTDVKDPNNNLAAAENRTSADEIKIVVREEGSSEALIALAVIIFVVLAIAFAVPTMGAKDEDEEDKKVDEEEEEEEEKGEEDEEGTLPDDEE
jgi:hypothetical protein